MKILEFTEFEPGPGKEFNATSYPRNGGFIHPNGTMVVVTNGAVYSIAQASHLLKDMPLVGGALGAPAAPQSAGITEATLLKALAIAQNPALAVQLTSEQA